MASSKHPILLAEDNLNDVLFIERVIQRGNLPFRLHRVPNGEEAVNYLQGAGPYSDRTHHPLPSLVISNIRMPRMNGLELLHWIRQHPEWKTLPVVVLSSSGEPGEFGQCKALGVNAYFIKPANLDELLKSLQQISTLLPPTS